MLRSLLRLATVRADDAEAKHERNHHLRAVREKRCLPLLTHRAEQRRRRRRPRGGRRGRRIARVGGVGRLSKRRCEQAQQRLDHRRVTCEALYQLRRRRTERSRLLEQRVPRRLRGPRRQASIRPSMPRCASSASRSSAARRATRP